MFQSFDVKSDPSQGAERVARLRRWIKEERLAGFLVPRADEHQGEYVAACSERLSWLTGFTGSAGTALVLERKALLFVDGRYTLQARNQVDPSIFSIENLIDNPPDKWLGANLARGDRIGFDPWLHTISDAKELRAAIAGRDGELHHAGDEFTLGLQVDGVIVETDHAGDFPRQQRGRGRLTGRRVVKLHVEALFLVVAELLGELGRQVDLLVDAADHDLHLGLGLRGRRGQRQRRGQKQQRQRQRRG